MLENDFDHLLKIVIIGDSGVGKSSLLLRYCDDRFSSSQSATVGVDFMVKVLHLMGKKIKLSIWDTGAQGVILMYDATNRSSFESLGYWLSEIQQHSTNSNVVKMLLGSKLDSAKSKLEVSRSQGEVFAIEHSMLFFEVSSKNGLGISESFTELVQAILDNPVLLRNTTPESVLSPKSRRQLSSNIRSSRRCFFI